MKTPLIALATLIVAISPVAAKDKHHGSSHHGSSHHGSSHHHSSTNHGSYRHHYVPHGYSHNYGSYYDGGRGYYDDGDIQPYYSSGYYGQRYYQHSDYGRYEAPHHHHRGLYLNLFGL